MKSFASLLTLIYVVPIRQYGHGELYVEECSLVFAHRQTDACQSICSTYILPIGIDFEEILGADGPRTNVSGGRYRRSTLRSELHTVPSLCSQNFAQTKVSYFRSSRFVEQNWF